MLHMLVTLYGQQHIQRRFAFFSSMDHTIPPISGVATLSITDSSATSSEDASNPDSPYNSSNGNELLQQHLNDAKHSKQNQQVLNNNNNNKNAKQVSLENYH